MTSLAELMDGRPGGGASRIPVLIVGAGPVGLAAGVELGKRGIRAVIIERQERAGYQPRAKTTHVRTVEHMRRWGIAENLRAASPLPADYPTDVIFKTRLDGFELAHFKNAFSGYRARDERYSESAQWIPQYKVEGVLREEVQRLPTVSLIFGVELVDLVQDDAGVRVRARRVGASDTFDIEAEYVIGADGPRSAVRKSLNIMTHGDMGLGRHLNVILQSADLGTSPPDKRAIMYWIVNPESPSVIAPMDAGNVWAFLTSLKPEETTLPEEEIARRLFIAVGRPIAFEVLAQDYWQASRVSAASYGDGRVWLAGDACHTHPPFGGYGMNMGIADAVDIGWKIAATLQGWGSPALVASYEVERRPVHDTVMDEAVKNHAVLNQHFVAPELEDDTPAGAEVRRTIGARILATKANEFHTLGVVLGVNYADSPYVVVDGSSPPPFSTTYAASASPGCLAPHAWLADTSSLYDQFGPGFTLLVLAHDHAGDEAAMIAAAGAAHVPMKVVHLPDAKLRALYGADMALVRPDQHVAWRGDAAVDPDAIFTCVTGRLAVPEAIRQPAA